MIYYLIMHFIEPVGIDYPNPFDVYEYGLGVNMIVEALLAVLTFWVCKIIGYRLSIKRYQFAFAPILYILYYIITWGCFWIPSFLLALGASIFALLIFNVIILILVDKLFKPRMN